MVLHHGCVRFIHAFSTLPFTRSRLAVTVGSRYTFTRLTTVVCGFVLRLVQFCRFTSPHVYLPRITRVHLFSAAFWLRSLVFTGLRFAVSGSRLFTRTFVSSRFRFASFRFVRSFVRWDSPGSLYIVTFKRHFLSFVFSFSHAVRTTHFRFLFMVAAFRLLTRLPLLVLHAAPLVCWFVLSSHVIFLAFTFVHLSFCWFFGCYVCLCVLCAPVCAWFAVPVDTSRIATFTVLDNVFSSHVRVCARSLASHLYNGLPQRYAYRSTHCVCAGPHTFYTSRTVYAAVTHTRLVTHSLSFCAARVYTSLWLF